VHYLPVRLTAPTAPHPRYLSLAERTVIADLHRAGVGVRGIAEELGRAPSTVSRELRRNIDGPGRYLPATAQRLSVERRSRAVPLRRVVRDNELHGVVTALLDSGGAPNKSATNSGRTFLINPSATCARSRSIRRSTIRGPM
jgi:IS30 family transposase